MTSQEQLHNLFLEADREWGRGNRRRAFNLFLKAASKGQIALTTRRHGKWEETSPNFNPRDSERAAQHENETAQLDVRHSNLLFAMSGSMSLEA
jgi:hypothetical protein